MRFHPRVWLLLAASMLSAGELLSLPQRYIGPPPELSKHTIEQSEAYFATEYSLLSVEGDPLSQPVKSVEEEIYLAAVNHGLDPEWFGILVAQSIGTHCGEGTTKLRPVQIVEQANILAALLKANLSSLGFQALGSKEQLQVVEAGLNAKMRSSQMTQAEIRDLMAQRIGGIFVDVDPDFSQLRDSAFDGLFAVVLDDVLEKRSPQRSRSEMPPLQCPIPESEDAPKRRGSVRVAGL